MLSLISTVCFFFGSSWLFILFVKDITEDLEFLNVGGVSRNHSRVKMKQRLCKNIQNYLEIKQLSSYSITLSVKNLSDFFLSFRRFVDEFNSIYEYTFFAFFGATLLFVCSSLIILLSQLVECLSQFDNHIFIFSDFFKKLIIFVFFVIYLKSRMVQIRQTY